MRSLLLPAHLPAGWREDAKHCGKRRIWKVRGAAVLLYLVNEDGATQAPPPRLTGPVEGAVLGDNHHVNGDAVVTGLLRRQPEVEAVAGVVLDDEEDTRGSCGKGGGVYYLYVD